MRKFKVNVNGTSYNVEVTEEGAVSVATPATAPMPVTVPAAAAAPAPAARAPSAPPQSGAARGAPGCRPRAGHTPRSAPGSRPRPGGASGARPALQLPPGQALSAAHTRGRRRTRPPCAGSTYIVGCRVLGFTSGSLGLHRRF